VSDSQAELEDAVFEFHQYLSDFKAPLMVADSVALLLQQDPEFVATQIYEWVCAQGPSAPAADYLFHAAKKIAMMGEFELVTAAAQLEQYLEDLGDALLKFCPEGDRDLLRQSLARLKHATPTRQIPVGIAAPRRDEAPPVQVPSSGLGADARRLSLILERLRPLSAGPAAAPQAAARRSELASQFISAAAVQSSNIRQLEQNLMPLTQMGVDTANAEMFRTLAENLAGWMLPAAHGQATAVSEQIQAMRQLVSLTEDPAEAAKRFRELVHAAIEQFNGGHLGRALMMFELSERLITEQKVQAVFTDALRNQGHEYLNKDRLRKYSERAELRSQLRPVLQFFTVLQPRGLLEALNGEPSRDRRHELLALLEVHEKATRTVAWEMLQASVQPGEKPDPFFQMNLIYLMRVIPRPDDAAAVEEEVNVVSVVCSRSSPAPLVKQAIAFLAQSRHDKAERALISYLKVFETLLQQGDSSRYALAEVEILLDRTCAALARYGTPRAWRLLIDHGLKSEARLGSPFLRLSEAGRVDLSGSRDLVERVIAALRQEIPVPAMIPVRKNVEKALALVQALSGTPLPEVERVMEEIVGGTTDARLREAAAKGLRALATVGKPAAPVGLSGDLELFGLPTLLQTIAQSPLSGVLSIMDTSGATRATLLFEAGKFLGGHNGQVRGEEAVYELLERPFSGTFALVNRTDAASAYRQPPEEVFSLLMEGIRRHDEFKRAAALISDTAVFKPIPGAAHSLPENEDPDFATLVWTEICSGKTPQECEAGIGTDSYRPRRLVAHWVQEGALQSR
jgi:hypothetical protein